MKQKNYSLKEMDKLADALLFGAGAMQTMPLLSKQGRTPSAMAGTASGFVGIGLLGAAKNASFKMLETQSGFKKKRKAKRR